MTREERIQAEIAACTGCNQAGFTKRDDCDGCVAAVDDAIAAELAATIALLHARINELEAQMWQDIASAPKTSCARLVWCPTWQNIYCVCWAELSGQWQHFGGMAGCLNDAPTHWRPLPNPPSAP